ncbi:MAG: hypothetical protein MN733_13825 [Nitrososphaera sp.]|nr:hypothetical protein [Nitrososphaera sp.]
MLIRLVIIAFLFLCSIPFFISEEPDKEEELRTLDMLACFDLSHNHNDSLVILHACLKSLEEKE